MASVFAGLAEYLFGIDKLDAQRQQQMEEYLATQARDYAAREQADYARQEGYGRTLLDTIHGQTPSVAGLQLQQGMDAINRQGQSAVAGASGNNAGIIGYGSLLSGGQMAAQLQGQQAIQRAHEIATAQGLYGNLLGGMGARSAQLEGTTLGTGLGYGQLGTEIQQANQKASAASLGTLLGSAGSAIGAMVGGPTGAAVGGQAGVAGKSYGSSADAAPMNPYAAAQPGYADSNINYGSALTSADQPQDPYQASYSDGLYRGPSTDRGMR